MSEKTKQILNLVFATALCGSAVGGLLYRESTDLALRTRVTDMSESGSRQASLDSQKNIPAGEYFTKLSQLLKNEYIDSVQNESKLAVGAVRGMISNLNDTHAVFYDDRIFPIYKREQLGQYEGIGADFALIRDGDLTDPQGAERGTIPKIMVIGVIPGGPADLAGVKPGFWVEAIDGKWVINPSLSELIKSITQKIERKELTQDEIDAERRELREKIENYIPVMRAREKLSKGTNGVIQVTWHTPTGIKTTPIEKKSTHVTAVEKQADGSHTLRFIKGASESLKSVVSEGNPITLDLRSAGTGRYDDMLLCLEALLPAGTYGKLSTFRDKKGEPFVLKNGANRKTPVRLLVNQNTRGVAEVFVNVLKVAGTATVVGKTGGDPTIMKDYSLPNQSGYSLPVARYNIGGAK